MHSMTTFADQPIVPKVYQASGDAVIAADPKRWEGYALKGRALAALGRHDEAGVVF